MKMTPWLVAAALAAPAWLCAAEPACLALELDGEGRREAAAVEFRRLALAEPDAAAAGGWFWLAAHEYAQAGQPAICASADCTSAGLSSPSR